MRLTSGLVLVFPAHAGMSLRKYEDYFTVYGFPRSRGDEPSVPACAASLAEFSPLTRG